jgi:polyisoprenoid-binding protein YceI
MRRLLVSVLAVSVLMGGSVQARAEAVKFTIEKPHTQILFFVNHLGYSHSMGKFMDHTGTIMWDKDAPEKSSVEVSIPTTSLEMGDATWNDHMKAAKFFDVAQFPTMTFKSTGIEKTGEKTANITGDLTLKGVTKPVVLATTFNNQGKHPFAGKEWIGFSANTTIKRSEFGMTEAVPMVGDDVEIRLEVEAFVEDPANNTNKQ